MHIVLQLVHLLWKKSIFNIIWSSTLPHHNILFNSIVLIFHCSTYRNQYGFSSSAYLIKIIFSKKALTTRACCKNCFVNNIILRIRKYFITSKIIWQNNVLIYNTLYYYKNISLYVISLYTVTLFSEEMIKRYRIDVDRLIISHWI